MYSHNENKFVFIAANCDVHMVLCSCFSIVLFVILDYL